MQIRVSVWKAVSEELSVVIHRDCVDEGKCIESPRELDIAITLVAILEVIYLLTNPMPSNTLNILDLCRVAEHFHTVVVERIGLG